MSISAIVKALVGAGATPEMILAAVQADEQERIHKEEAVRVKARDRKRKERQSQMSHDVTVTKRDMHGQGVTDCDTPLSSSSPLVPPSSFPTPLTTTPLNPPISNSPPSENTAGEGEKPIFYPDRITTPAGFFLFFENFPRQRRGSRDGAAAAYCRAIERGNTEEMIHEGLERYVGSDDVADGCATTAAKWLNDDGFNNEYRAAGQSKKQRTGRTNGGADGKIPYGSQIDIAGEAALRYHENLTKGGEEIY